MQKENPVANSVRQIKICCAKYKGPLLNSMKISQRRVEKYLFFSTLLAATSSIYPKVNYFPKIEDHISQENDKF